MTDATRPSIDVHVHLHPPRLADAITRHFAQRDWRTAHSFDPDEVAATLRAHGVDRFCCFSYAHRAGVARSINPWIAETAHRLPGAIGFGTVHPDDPDYLEATDEALHDLRLAGLKFHCSVQRLTPDDPRLFPVYERVLAADRLLMLHAGTLPYRDHYTGVAHVRPVMARFPGLRVCIAHLGADESRAFLELTERYEHLYLDTTMALAPIASGYVGGDTRAVDTDTLLRHQDRILFGSDFPLLPYAYEEERNWAVSRGLGAPVQRKIFHDNALAYLAPVLPDWSAG